ncbi:alpha/beta fold hydrolase [Nocardia sp. NPDC088792]|uniref:alpha/beta fold hydrolase n=1 Tax=Nocardia sp. NPDC088792 TaxID=3364332 RepID=UPI0038242750
MAALPYGHLVRKRLPHSTFRTLPTGHVVFASAPEKFLDLVTPFIASTSVPAPGNKSKL